MSISIDEFNALQQQFLALKTTNYEYQEKERYWKNEAEKAKNEAKRLNDVIVKSKKTVEVNQLMKENETLLRNMELAQQQHQEQQEALRASIKSLFQSNNDLQNQLDAYQKKEKAQQKEAEIRKTMQQEQQDSNHSEETKIIPNLDLTELHQQLRDQNKLDESVTEEILNKVKSIWKEQFDQYLEKNKVSNEKDTTERVQSLQEELTKTREDFSSKELNLNEQITMWKEKTKIKQSNFIKLEEEFKLELANQKQKFESEIQELNDNLKKKTEELAVANSELSRKKEELFVVQNDRNEIISSLSDKDVATDKLKDEIMSQKNQIEKANSSIASLQETLQKERETFTDSLKQRAEQISKLNEQISEYRTKISDLDDRLNTARISREQYNLQAKDLSNKVTEQEELVHKKEVEIKSHLDEIQSLKGIIAKKDSSINDLSKQVSDLTANLSNSKQEVSTQSEKIKQLEETKLKQQKEIDELKKQNEERKVAIVEKDKEIKDLKSQLESISKTREEELNQHSEVTSNFETEIKVKTAQIEQFSDQVSKQLGKIEGLEKEIEQLNQIKEKFTEESEQQRKQIDEKEEKIQELTRSIEDTKTEVKITERKFARQLKEAKDLLAKERRQLEKLQQQQQLSAITLSISHPGSSSNSGTNSPLPRSSSFSSITPPEKPSPPSTPRGSITPSTSSASLNITGISTPNYADSRSARNSLVREPSPSELQAEINTLVKQMGELQAEKWKTEEKLSVLEETVSMLRQDIEKKDIIIRNHVISSKVQGRATPEMEVNRAERASKSGIMATLFRGSQKDLPADVTQKMTNVLEETLLKNIQLQNDIGVLGAEVSKLLEENKKLKTELEKFGTSSE